MHDPSYEEWKSALPDDDAWHQAEEEIREFGDPAASSGLPSRCPDGQHEWASIVVCRVCLEQPNA